MCGLSEKFLEKLRFLEGIKERGMNHSLKIEEAPNTKIFKSQVKVKVKEEYNNNEKTDVYFP